jgi:integrase-like protein
MAGQPTDSQDQGIKSIPYTPISHPFFERLIGTIRREYFNHIFFWNAQELERKLGGFLLYYNHTLIHQSLGKSAPFEVSGGHQPLPANCGTIRGYQIATDFFRRQLPHELGILLGHT